MTLEKLTLVHKNLYNYLNSQYSIPDSREKRVEIMDAIMVIDDLIWDNYKVVLLTKYD